MIKSDDLDCESALVLIDIDHKPIDREPDKPSVRFELADEDKEQLALVPNCAKWSMNKFGAESLFFLRLHATLAVSRCCEC